MSHQIRYPDGRTFGPYPLEDIKKYAAGGTFPAGTEVHTQTGWRNVGEWLTSLDAPPPPTAAVAETKASAAGGRPKRLLKILAAVAAVVLVGIAGVVALLVHVAQDAAEEKRVADAAAAAEREQSIKEARQRIEELKRNLSGTGE